MLSITQIHAVQIVLANLIKLANYLLLILAVVFIFFNTRCCSYSTVQYQCLILNHIRNGYTVDYELCRDYFPCFIRNFRPNAMKLSKWLLIFMNVLLCIYFIIALDMH